MAKDAFVVVNDRGPNNPWIVYVVEEQLPRAPNFDPRDVSSQDGYILLEVPVAISAAGEESFSHCLIQAMARLDSGTNSDSNRRALAEVFRLGMMAQRELDKKGLVSTNSDVANGSR